MNHGKPKILIGYTNVAALGMRLQKGFSEIGIKADFYSKDIVINKYDYKKDFLYKTIRKYDNSILSFFNKLYLLLKYLIKYKYFIYISTGSALLSKKREIKLLQKFGKKFMIIYTGCDSRIPELVGKYKWNPCSDCNNEYKIFVGCDIPNKLSNLKNDVNLFDVILSPDECSGFFEGKYIPAFFPINLDDYEIVSSRNNKIRILHAPSNEDYKGTRYIDAAISRLSSKYEFEYVKINNIKLDELYDEIKKSDIIIDQMLSGFYGLFAIESMAFGKPVFCYIHDDIWVRIKDNCPVINANVGNLKKKLEYYLDNTNELQKLGTKSREYVELYHNSGKIAKEYLSYLEKDRNN